ncbi:MULTISPECIES: single-stranded DNA-binding protein [Protofrankia]|uniref:Single-stranded DNA-binding protein n=1 Tax=Protofrankia coriariae TaxID=1562887 RepID=A0ABR5F451_9ACTN|nr:MULTISPECIES: single-stranded DNA-binding protein [Protofrankia]KLL11472.1 single-stranded DNA-binding protein [Protofrankia coriariae]ONH34957.1 single-stranded DNA-binding protein [Protofrankia sp. BMG5.30]
MANDTPLTVVGNLTADPELRFTPAGIAMARFTVAATPRTFDKARNTWVDGEAMFLGCTAWRQLAEHAAESLTKGTRVVVTGRLRQHHWTTDTGEKRSTFALDVDEIGPSLRFATAKVTKATRGSADNYPPTGPDDPWSAPAPAPVGAGTGADTPPF